MSPFGSPHLFSAAVAANEMRTKQTWQMIDYFVVNDHWPVSYFPIQFIIVVCGKLWGERFIYIQHIFSALFTTDMLIVVFSAHFEMAKGKKVAWLPYVGLSAKMVFEVFLSCSHLWKCFQAQATDKALLILLLVRHMHQFVWAGGFKWKLLITL